jgi:hypothetical protein
MRQMTLWDKARHPGDDYLSLDKKKHLDEPRLQIRQEQRFYFLLRDF